jgi:hypothetical protein
MRITYRREEEETLQIPGIIFPGDVPMLHMILKKWSTACDSSKYNREILRRAFTDWSITTAPVRILTYYGPVEQDPRPPIEFGKRAKKAGDDAQNANDELLADAGVQSQRDDHPHVVNALAARPLAGKEAFGRWLLTIDLDDLKQIRDNLEATVRTGNATYLGSLFMPVMNEYKSLMTLKTRVTVTECYLRSIWAKTIKNVGMSQAQLQSAVSERIGRLENAAAMHD